MIDVANICMALEQDPKAWVIGRTVLIPKPGKSLEEYLTFLNDWRQITLLITFHKVLTAMAANRLDKWERIQTVGLGLNLGLSRNRWMRGSCGRCHLSHRDHE
jgi:hypothetical protein